jgi:hypothetical protein
VHLPQPSQSDWIWSESAVWNNAVTKNFNCVFSLFRSFWEDFFLKTAKENFYRRCKLCVRHLLFFQFLFSHYFFLYRRRKISSVYFKRRSRGRQIVRVLIVIEQHT